MRRFLASLAAACILFAACAKPATPAGPSASAPAAHEAASPTPPIALHIAPTPTLVPPVLVQKEISKWPDPPAGLTADLDAPTSTTFVLFVPENVQYDADGGTTLTIHFHAAAWFIAQEHTRRGAHHPLIVGNAKEADAVFETDIMQPGLLRGLLTQAERTLKEAGGPPNAHVTRLELSGFSAGYAGVRGILRLPEFEPMVTRVMLNDSLYVGDSPESKKPDDRKPRLGGDGLGPFIDFARKAAAGERTLLMEHSSTPSMRSVGPMDCSRATIAALGLTINDVAPESIPAARSTADYQLIWRADAGNAHFWCYRAAERPIHLSHVRNQADFWRAIDGLTSTQPIPPAMPVRSIKATELAGESIALDIGTTGTVTLYLPPGYKVPKDGAVELNVNFHATTWFVIQEHLRRGMGEPLVALELGQGSTAYRVPFEDPTRFARLMDAVVVALKQKGGPENTRIDSVNITSFSAGYGAVREIIKSPEYVAVIKRIALGDSSYASLDETLLKEGKRVVLAEHVEPWANFARLAITGKKTLLMTTSEIAPSTYAGTFEVARAVANAVGVEVKDIAPGSCPAASSELPYMLNAQADSGSFHWWGYTGNDAMVHMTLARHIAESWMALDQCGDP